MASWTASMASSGSRSATCAMRNARRSMSARNLSSSRVCSRTAPLGAGAGPSHTIQALGSVSKPDIPRPLASTGSTRYGYNACGSRRLTASSQDQRLTHIDFDPPCNICKTLLYQASRGWRNPLICLDSFRFRTLFRQFDYVSKQNGHLGLMIPVSQQTYPQVLWTRDPS